MKRESESYGYSAPDRIYSVVVGVLALLWHDTPPPSYESASKWSDFPFSSYLPSRG